MKIVPNTVIELYKDIPLKKDYLNVFLPKDGNKDVLFSSKNLLGRWSDFSYQRQYDRIRIPISADTIYNANYIRYKNSNYGNKWFYGFVDRIEWANDNVAFVYFTIDLYFTWQENFTINPSFVERCHTPDDTPGAYTYPESFTLGPIVNNTSNFMVNLDPLAICVAIAYEAEQSETIVTGNIGADVVLYNIPTVKKKYAGGQIVSGVYCGSKYLLWKIDQIDNLNQYLTDLMDKGAIDLVTSIFMIPEYFAGTTVVGNGQEITQDFNVTKEVFAIDHRYDSFGALDNYRPRNKKLLTYPFNYIAVDNLQGTEVIYELENFADSNDEDIPISFYLQTSFGNNPTCRLLPQSYKQKYGRPETNVLNLAFEYPVPMSGWPLCSFAYSAYQNYLGQNMITNQTQSQNTVFSYVIDFLKDLLNMQWGNAVEGLLNPYKEITDKVAQAQDQNKIPNTVSGNANMGNLNAGYSMNKFVLYHKSITYAYASKIDNYFDMFGYRINDLAEVESLLTNRPIWNYVKTVGAIVVGDAPQEAINTFENMLNSGVTFWHTTDVGNYLAGNNEV